MGTVVGDTVTVRRRRRVLFFPLPFQGHINPTFQLAGLLHARGLAITVFHTQFNAPNPSQHPHYDFVPVPGVIDADEGSSSDMVRATLERVHAVNRECEAPFRERLAALLSAQQHSGQEEDVACLIADAHLLPLMDVARGLGVPALVQRTGSAASFRLQSTIHRSAPVLRDHAAQESSELDAPVPELPPYRVRDLVPANTVLRDVIARLVNAATSSSGLIFNTLDALESDELASLRRDYAVPVFPIGPLHKLSPAASSSLLRQDRGCLDWLDAQEPASVLYVSFGSLASMSASELVEMAWGIADSGRPFLWVLRPGLVRDRDAADSPLPDGFDAATRGRGVIVSWAPQEEVLAHAAVGGFWTHCGWNSMLEAVCAGVPMLCRPCFGDQIWNARYVEHMWRVGVGLDGELQRGKVQAAIETLMDGAELRQKAMELKSRAAECIAEAASSATNVDNLVKHILSL